MKNSEHGVKSIHPKDAWQLLQDNPKAVLIDIRSTMEYLFIGHPKGSVHIPWINEPEWKINPHFAAEVRKVLLGGVIEDFDDEATSLEGAPILLICRSGRRSLEAGKLLVKEGLKHVHNIIEGFEGDLDSDHHRSMLGGWRFHNLPWEQC